MEVDDVIYGKFFIPGDVAEIVATKQFQRLKSIRQLGFLFLDDNQDKQHRRYAHCLGTYKAASLMLDALEKNTPCVSQNNNEYDMENFNVEQQKYKIPPVYRKAVQLAGLLHDVAHGPFSHSWEYVVKDYCHEKLAFPCIDEIFKQIDAKLFPELRQNNNYGIELIKSLIEGDINNFKYKLPQNFQFIFEIVSNSRTKIDVDKWDYLRRDFYYINHISQPNIDFNDVFLKAKISPCGSHIEYRYEDYNKIYNLFLTRYDFHLNCYSLPEYYLAHYVLNLAVQEIKPKVNNILVTHLDSYNMPEFLQLTDDYVLELVKDSKLSKFLRKETKYQKLDIEKLEMNIAKDNAVVKIEVLPINIKSVRDYMPSDEALHFYGDSKKKSIINDQTKNIKKIYPCYCDHRTETIYYSIVYLND